MFVRGMRVMKKFKQLPLVVKGCIILLLISGTIFITANGLQIMEQKQQKPRILSAVAELAVSAADEKYNLEKLWQLLENETIEYDGKISFSSIGKDFFPKQLQTILPYIEHSSVDFTLKKDAVSRMAAMQAEMSLYFMHFEMDGYLDDTSCIIHLPALHEKYISFSPDNLKKQYNDSLFYPIFGEQDLLPQKNLADYVFQNTEASVSKEKEVIITELSEAVRNMKKLYDNITVEKAKEKEAVYRNGSYKNCERYHMTVPSSVLNQLLKDIVWKNTGHTLSVREESLSIILWLDSKKQILKAEIPQTVLLADGKAVPAELIFYPQGAENPWDNIEMEIQLVLDDINYGFTITANHSFTDIKRTLHVSIALTEPYVTKLLDIDMDYLYTTGETSFDFVCKIPGLSADGRLGIKRLTESVAKPAEEAVPIFKLNLLEALTFANRINWSFFKNQE